MRRDRALLGRPVTSQDPLPLHLSPYERWGEYAPLIKGAKPLSGVTVTFKPTPATPGCGRLILLGDGLPPFACDYARVRLNMAPVIVAQILSWYAGRKDPRASTMADWLSAVLGGEVTEAKEEVLWDAI